MFNVNDQPVLEALTDNALYVVSRSNQHGRRRTVIKVFPFIALIQYNVWWYNYSVIDEPAKRNTENHHYVNVNR